MIIYLLSFLLSTFLYIIFRHLFHNHLPAKLDAEAGSLVSDRIPREYLKRGVASCLASRIVYQEGIQFVEQHDNHRLAPLAFDYLKVGSFPRPSIFRKDLHCRGLKRKKIMIMC